MRLCKLAIEKNFRCNKVNDNRCCIDCKLKSNICCCSALNKSTGTCAEDVYMIESEG